MITEQERKDMVKRQILNLVNDKNWSISMKLAVKYLNLAIEYETGIPGNLKKPRECPVGIKRDSNTIRNAAINLVHEAKSVSELTVENLIKRAYEEERRTNKKRGL